MAQCIFPAESPNPEGTLYGEFAKNVAKAAHHEDDFIWITFAHQHALLDVQNLGSFDFVRDVTTPGR